MIGGATLPSPRHRRRPSADAVAAALVVTCKAVGESPLLVAAGGIPCSLGALHAVAGLKRAFPAVFYPELFRLCGVPAASLVELEVARNSSAWNPALVHAAQCAAAAVTT